MNINFTGKITKIGAQKIIPTKNNTQMEYVDITVSVNRGNAEKRYSYYDQQEYSVDFYKVTFVGAKARSFVQYASVGRTISISGRLLQNEYYSRKDNVVVITPDNPMYNYLRSAVGQAPNNVITLDQQNGNVLMFAKTLMHSVTVQCIEYQWLGGNTSNNFGFQPNEHSFPNAQSGFGQQNSFATAPQGNSFGNTMQNGFGTAPQNNGFGNGFGQPANNGFGQQQMNNGFGQQNNGFAPQNNGFGTAPQQNNGFGGVNQNNGFANQPNGFGTAPQTNGFATQPANNGFATQQNGFGQPAVTNDFSANPMVNDLANTPVTNGFEVSAEQNTVTESPKLPGFGANENAINAFDNSAVTENTGNAVDFVPANAETKAENSVETNIPQPNTTANTKSTTTK